VGKRGRHPPREKNGVGGKGEKWPISGIFKKKVVSGGGGKKKQKKRGIWGEKEVYRGVTVVGTQKGKQV